jgi:hypothetical protein
VQDGADIVTTVLIVLVILGASSCQPRKPPLSAEHRFYIRAETFKPAPHVGDLPVSVREALRVLFNEPALTIADPGAPFQDTDITPTGGVPSRRLIAAGCSTEHCLVHYEHGGGRRTVHVVLFGLFGERAAFEWGGQTSRPERDVTVVKGLMLRGAIDSSASF